MTAVGLNILLGRPEFDQRLRNLNFGHAKLFMAVVKHVEELCKASGIEISVALKSALELVVKLPQAASVVNEGSNHPCIRDFMERDRGSFALDFEQYIPVEMTLTGCDAAKGVAIPFECSYHSENPTVSEVDDLLQAFEHAHFGSKAGKLLQRPGVFELLLYLPGCDLSGDENSGNRTNCLHPSSCFLTPEYAAKCANQQQNADQRQCADGYNESSASPSMYSLDHFLPIAKRENSNMIYDLVGAERQHLVCSPLSEALIRANFTHEREMGLVAA